MANVRNNSQCIKVLYRIFMHIAGLNILPNY